MHPRTQRPQAAPRLLPGEPARRVACAAAGTILLLAAGAALAESRTLSRDEAIQLAFRNNRDLRVAVLEIDRATSRSRWSGRLENPVLDISGRGDAIGRDDDEGVFEVAFTQDFPLTSRLRKEKDVRRHQILLAEAEIAERRRQLAGEIDHAIIDLLATREMIELQGRLAEINQEIVDFLKLQVERGEASSLEVTQALLDVRTIEQEAKSLRAEETQKLIALNGLLGVDATDDTRITGSLDLPGSRPETEADLDAILARRPDYVLAAARIDEARAAIALEEASRWEDMSVSLILEREDAVDEPDGLESNTFAGVGFSIPLPLRKRNQDGIEQARIDHTAARKGVEAVRFRIRGEAEKAYHDRADAWAIARDSTGELLRLAEKNLEDFRGAYQQGQAELVQVQKAQEQVLRLRTAGAGFLADYHHACADVRTATGAYPGIAVIRATPSK